MSEFTKGPWNYRPDQYDDWGVVKADNGWTVAKASGGDYKTQAQLEVYRKNRTDPYEANARLIAAAPDLYEALQVLRSFMWAEGYADQTAAMAQADAAIRKAEGL